ncbi:DNA (cytosine-5-)-methyltransferase [Pseudodesulfovibrio sp. F-1]|uniref:Cytosine-specific methyltransferase n=1 Tax=Pseudodesulfovibrio alkaliphilus TaxID=2661613 RepID=A0A7K1KMY8_9BACT|nr:DNA cytosine methyltransferase [Pseudodesulfovibrio alkaliphilus]MUM77242.1 DNA (cytosine-5-)-methyltransferase [Pseudodesulfovibrio alkaliphilus]
MAEVVQSPTNGGSKINMTAFTTTLTKNRLPAPTPGMISSRNHLIEPSYQGTGITTDLRNRATVISLFSGCGGLDLGFVGGFDFLGTHYEKTQLDIVWANEINAAACRTYRKNIGNHLIEGDVWDALPTVPGNADAVIGGFPCQDISVNGKGAGVDGKRSGLYRAMVEVVDRVRPKIFVAENVKGLIMRHNETSLRRILKDFAEKGYTVSHRLYQAADYGVPQTRERVFIVGTRSDVPEFIHPEPVCTTHISAKEAIGDLEHLERTEEFNHIWSRASKSAEQGNRKLIAERPGYTIRAECHGNIQFHYSLPRRISMREAARFQSFPDNYLFDAKLRETERQVGNAVPPVLAWHIAKAVELVLDGCQP